MQTRREVPEFWNPSLHVKRIAIRPSVKLLNSEIPLHAKYVDLAIHVQHLISNLARAIDDLIVAGPALGELVGSMADWRVAMACATGNFSSTTGPFHKAVRPTHLACIVHARESRSG